MNKARFPARSVNKHQRRQGSYHDLPGTICEGGSAEYKEAKIKLIDELPSLRKACEGLERLEHEEFHGFSSNDAVKSVCTTKKAELTSIVSSLENCPIIPPNGSAKGMGQSFSVRAKSKRIADRNEVSVGIKMKIPIEQEVNASEKVIDTAESKPVAEVIDPLKTPAKSFVEEQKTHPVQALDEKSFDAFFVPERDNTSPVKTESGMKVKANSAPKVSENFFRGKEEYVAAVVVLCDPKLTQDFESLHPLKGLIQCGVCLDIAESNTLGAQKKNGAFMCLKCVDFLQKMLKIAKKAEAFTCQLRGTCEITQNADYCEGCFVRNCLLMLDLNDDIYFKLWRSVPPISKNWVPPTPPVAKRYPNRGKVLYVNQQNGSILHVCPFKNKTIINCRSENSVNGNFISTNGGSKSKGVKRLLPNDDSSRAKVSGARVKQVSRRNVERLPRATFGDATEIKEGCSEANTSNMLLGRLEKEEKMVKVLCPLESYEPEEAGYPVVVLQGDEPPKPLCFGCGSAGIRQLIFCSTCCEPFHPYCSEDELLLSAFIEEIVKETPEEAKKSVKPNCQCTYETDKHQSSCSSCTSRLKSFHNWKCHRCTKCKICCKRELSNRIDLKESEFLKCIQCHDSFHQYCAKKVSFVTVKSSESNKWMCQKCLKCTSCGVQLSKSFQNNYRKLSTDGDGNIQEREMLCLECFKRRQKGSFCPICLACYDDNDWDSKMMECDKCGRWIHAKCEGLNDEQYYILSSLPENIVFVCRICVPPEVEVGWRQAMKTELHDGCLKVLEFFQKKVVGMCRKRRALTFDQNAVKVQPEPPYFTPNVKPEILPELVEIKSSESLQICVQSVKAPAPTSMTEKVIKKEGELFTKYKLKSCFVKLIDLDVTKNIEIVSDTTNDICNFSKRCRNGNKGNKDNLSEVTPKKISPTKLSQSNYEISQGSKVGNTPTPIKIFTPTRVITSLTDAIRATSTSWTSVADFRCLCLKLLPHYFLELDSRSTAHFEEYFEDAVTQVFPWFKVEDVKQENIFGSNISAASSDSGVEVDVRTESPLLAVEQPFAKEDNTVHTIAFEDIFWNNSLFMDNRECSFCQETGDFPLNSCGRLLYAGPGDWVHVNCAIWSSEVWEEETGALQQIEAALTRSKKTLCDFCEFLGASLNCCAGTCRRCYHFLCALDAGCSLMNDKTLFCPSHESAARGQIQKDMHVTRKVFVDLDGTRKKDLKLMSSNVKVFIGCLRIDKLGHVVPISLTENGSPASNVLIPVGYDCGRLYWSLPSMKKLQFYTLSTSLHCDRNIRNSFETILQDPASYNIVIDHKKRKDWVESKFEEMKTFFHWLKSAPRFIDEYNIEWTAPYTPKTNGTKVKRKHEFKRQKVDKILDHSVEDLDTMSVSEATQTRAVIQWKIKHSLDTSNLQEDFASEPHHRYHVSIVSEKSYFPLGLFNTHHEDDSIHKDVSTNSVNSYVTFVEQIGLKHPNILFLIEQLPGVETIVGKYKFKFHYPLVAPEDTPVEINPSGCARTEGFKKRKPFDMFGWLASRHRTAPAPLGIHEETVKSKGLPIAMRYRNLKERAGKDLAVLSSHIHGRGLFARRDIDMGEMLIEYAGETIRSPVCDVREKKYENEGMGCYMFRINRDLVIDATMKGNAARFINHSCEPNCESKSVKILGKDHILILALKNIGRGEELTYDYKFEREADKLPCSCASKKCRKFLN